MIIEAGPANSNIWKMCTICSHKIGGRVRARTPAVLMTPRFQDESPPIAVAYSSNLIRGIEFTLTRL